MNAPLMSIIYLFIYIYIYNYTLFETVGDNGDNNDNNDGRRATATGDGGHTVMRACDIIEGLSLPAKTGTPDSRPLPPEP